MKFFKATIQPKKSHPDNPEDLVFFSDQYATVKAFQDDLKKLMEEEDENHAFWFAPKVERITEEEFKENQPTGDVQDLPGVGEELAAAKEQLAEIEKQIEEVGAEIKNSSTSNAQYYWFEYVKGNPIVMRVVKNKNGKFNIRYRFESDLFIEVDKEFEKKENAIINVFGYVINDCMDSPSPEHNAIIKGIGGRDPETAIPSALMSDDEVSKYFGSASIEEKEESCGGFNDCGTCPSCKLKDFKPWEQDKTVEYKKLYGALVDVAAKYKGDSIPAISDCYRTFIDGIISYISIDRFNEDALVERVSLVENPHNFTNEASVKSLLMMAHPEKTETKSERSSIKPDETRDSGAYALCHLIGESAHKSNEIIDLIHGALDGCTEEVDFHVVCDTLIDSAKRGRLKSFSQIDTVEKLSNFYFAFVDLDRFDRKEPAELPPRTETAKDRLAKVFNDSDGVSQSVTVQSGEENHNNPISATELKEKSDIDKFTEKVGEAIEKVASLSDENDLGFDFGDSQETPKAQDDKSDFEKMIEEYNEKIEALEIGQTIVFEDMPNEIYHAVVGISSSKIKDAMISMMYYNAKHNTKEIERESGSQFDIGNVFHSICLEPDLTSKEYICEPSGEGVPQKPTTPQIEKYNEWVKLGSPEKPKNPKAYPTDLMFERCGFWNDFYETTNGRYPVAADDWKLAESMVNSAMNDEDASKLLRHPARRCETSYFKRCDTTGMIIKARPDIEVGRIIGDLKSIAFRGSYDEKYLISALRKEVFNRNYHLSAAMYLDITGKDQFLWIFTNKQKGYHWTATVRASSEILERGRELYLEYKQKISDAYTSGKWPKPESIQSKRNPETGKIELAEI
ncbi:MAG: hypothetical protein ACRCXG_16330 [Vibrio sp.]